jgi:hypothetical protein
MRACSSSAVENREDAIDVGNQLSCLQRFPCWGRAPKMALMFHFVTPNDLHSPGVPSLKPRQEPCQQMQGKVAALFLALQGLPKPVQCPDVLSP